MGVNASGRATVAPPAERKGLSGRY